MSYNRIRKPSRAARFCRAMYFIVAGIVLFYAVQGAFGPGA